MAGPFHYSGGGRWHSNSDRSGIDYASPFIAKAWFERNIPNTHARDRLPIPEIIVISHDHYDHLEASTIRFYADKPVTFYVPLGVGKHLIKWGVCADNIVEFDWWDSVHYAGIELICTPANHNSGRTYFDKTRPVGFLGHQRQRRDALF